MTEIDLLRGIVDHQDTESKEEWGQRWLVVGDWYEDQGRSAEALGCRRNSVLQRKPIKWDYPLKERNWSLYRTLIRSQNIKQKKNLHYSWIVRDWHPANEPEIKYFASAVEGYQWLIVWLSECTHFHPWTKEEVA